jgi:hypothetical protein
MTEIQRLTTALALFNANTAAALMADNFAAYNINK